MAYNITTKGTIRVRLNNNVVSQFTNEADAIAAAIKLVESHTTKDRITLDYSNYGKTLTKVAPVMPVIDSFTATPNMITEGESVTLTAAVRNATTLMIDGDPVTLPYTVTPKLPCTGFTLVAENDVGRVSATVPITVLHRKPFIESFTATPSTVMEGESLRLDASVRDATQLLLNDAPATFPVTVTPPKGCTGFTLTAISDGGTVKATVAVTVNTPALAVPFGFIDGADETSAHGWAIDKANPQKRATVIVLDGQTEIARVTADELREDVLAAGYGDGNSGWTATYPKLADGDHQISAIMVEGNYTLQSSPKLVHVGTPTAAEMKGYFSCENGIAEGWVADRAHPTRRFTVSVRVDGKEVGRGQTSTLRQDTGGWGDGYSGFSITFPPITAIGRHPVSVVAIEENYALLPGAPGWTVIVVEDPNPQPPQPTGSDLVETDASFKDRIEKSGAWLARPLLSRVPADANIPGPRPDNPAAAANLWSLERIGFVPSGGDGYKQPTFDPVKGLTLSIPQGSTEGAGGMVFMRAIDDAGNRHYMSKEGDEHFFGVTLEVDTPWARTPFRQRDGMAIGKKLGAFGAGPYPDPNDPYGVKAYYSSDTGKGVLTCYSGVNVEFSDVFLTVYGYGDGMGDDSAEVAISQNDYNMQPREGEPINVNDPNSYVSYAQYQQRWREGWTKYWVSPAARGLITPNERHTLTWHNKLGAYIRTAGDCRQHYMLTEIWHHKPGQGRQLAFRQTRKQWVQGQGIGQYLLFVSLTNKDPTQAHETAHIYYRNAWIAPRDAPDPIFEKVGGNTPQVAVDCVQSPWSDWVVTQDWTLNADKTKETRALKRTRSILVQPMNGGAPCGPNEETTTEERAYTPPQPPSPPTTSGIIRNISKNTMRAIDPDPTKQAIYYQATGGGINGIFDFVGGCVFVPDISAKGGLVHKGFGHDSGYANFWPIFNRETGLWEPTNTPYPAGRETTIDGWGNWEGKTGQQATTHPFGHMVALPKEWGGGERGSALELQMGATGRDTGIYTVAHRFDVATKTMSLYSGPAEGMGYHQEVPCYVDTNGKRFVKISVNTAGVYVLDPFSKPDLVTPHGTVRRWQLLSAGGLGGKAFGYCRSAAFAPEYNAGLFLHQVGDGSVELWAVRMSDFRFMLLGLISGAFAWGASAICWNSKKRALAAYAGGSGNRTMVWYSLGASLGEKVTEIGPEVFGGDSPNFNGCNENMPSYLYNRLQCTPEGTMLLCGGVDAPVQEWVPGGV